MVKSKDMREEFILVRQAISHIGTYTVSFMHIDILFLFYLKLEQVTIELCIQLSPTNYIPTWTGAQIAVVGKGNVHCSGRFEDVWVGKRLHF